MPTREHNGLLPIYAVFHGAEERMYRIGMGFVQDFPEAKYVFPFGNACKQRLVCSLV